jgi:ligand-binding sensor domain-containing protein
LRLGVTSRLLIATNAGLKLFDTDHETLTTANIPILPGQVRLLVRDRRGRLWMGGAGLWMLDGHDLIEFGSRMSATGSDVEASAGDPLSDGVVVLLKRGTVIFLSTR